jgi:lysozyme
MRAIPQEAIDLVVAQETPILWVYDDAKGAYRNGKPRPLAPGDVIHGKLTAGTGHTGDDVVLGMRVDQDQNDRWLLGDLQKAAFELEEKIGAEIVAMLTEGQYAALIDFVFNIGTGRPDRPEWTIWKRLRAKDFAQVPGELVKFVNAEVDGVMRKLPDLVKRRNAEVELWSEGEPGTRDVQIPSSVLREQITPPTPSDPVPASKSKALLIGATGAIAGAPPMIAQVTQAIQPYAWSSHYVRQALGVLATLAAVCACVGLVYMWLQKRQARN